MVEFFKNSLITMKPKINLKFFDEKWFNEIFLQSTIDAVSEVIKKNKERLVREGVWTSDEELEKSADELIRTLSEGMEKLP